MKTITFLFLSIFISNIAFSQEDKADYNDDYWSFSSKDIADFYISDNQSEVTHFKQNIYFPQIPISIAGEGKLTKGRKDGSWTGSYNDQKTYFKECYNNGKLKKGISYDIAGKPYFYKKEIQFAKPLKGWEDFFMYTHNYWNRVKTYIEENYPENFKLLKGREIEISIQLLISENGKVDIGEIKNGAMYGFDKTAAIKMLKNYRHEWLAALLKGQVTPSQIKYTVVLKF